MGKDMNDLHDLRDQSECEKCEHIRDEHDMAGECQVDDCLCQNFEGDLEPDDWDEEDDSAGYDDFDGSNTGNGPEEA